MILGLIFNIIFSIYLYSKCDNYKKHRLPQLLYTLVNILFNCISAYFMYKACQSCNGLWGFVLLFVISIVISIISTWLFNDSMKRMKVCLLGKVLNYEIDKMEKAK